MTKKISRYDRNIFIVAALSLVFFLYISPRLFPENGYRQGADRGTILLKARTIMEEMGYNVKGQTPNINMKHDEVQLKYLYAQFGSKRAISVMRDSIPVFQWVVKWEITSEDSTSDQTAASKDFTHLYLDLNGDPIQFQTTSGDKPDTLLGNEIVDFNIARLLAQRVFRNDEGKWVFDRIDIRGRSLNSYRRFRWHRLHETAGQTIDLTIDVRNGLIIKFLKKYSIPKHKPANINSNLPGLIMFGLLFALLIVAGVYFIQRLRRDTLDLKSGTLPAIFGGIATAGWLIWNYLSKGDPIGSQLFTFLIPVSIFAGCLWIFFSVSDSLAREEWPEKMFTFDAMRRRILFPETGLAIARGISLALLCLGLATAGGWLSITRFSGSLPLSPISSRVLFPSMMRLLVVFDSLFTSLFVSVIFLLFFMTLMRRWFKKRIWVILSTLIVMAAISLSASNLQPLGHLLILNGLVGLLFIHFFLRFDYLTILIGSFTLPLLYYGILFIRFGDSFMLHGIFLFVIIAAILFYALKAFYSETPEEKITGFVPDYIKRVSERERIQRELDIARHVQISFLPARTPEIPRLDIASVCLPAKEVGGDYFDFIPGPDRLGVVIGDVSGKGISAAFYMTLTKGFLKSMTQFHSSPREILIHMNKLFYENAERGMFISMIIGVFDLKASTLTFSRAGHNPMIFYKAETGLAEEIDVPGMALGLDSGRLFNKTIQERTLSFSKDDVFLFYTDGINEAQDTAKNEFGEEKLMHLIETYHDNSSSVILEKIHQNLEIFTAGTEQHDDITAILVKTC